MRLWRVTLERASISRSEFAPGARFGPCRGAATCFPVSDPWPPGDAGRWDLLIHPLDRGRGIVEGKAVACGIPEAKAVRQADCREAGLPGRMGDNAVPSVAVGPAGEVEQSILARERRSPGCGGDDFRGGAFDMLGPSDEGARAFGERLFASRRQAFDQGDREIQSGKGRWERYGNRALLRLGACSGPTMTVASLPVRRALRSCCMIARPGARISP